jgi:hypothetical protein
MPEIDWKQTDYAGGEIRLALSGDIDEEWVGLFRPKAERPLRDLGIKLTSADLDGSRLVMRVGDVSGRPVEKIPSALKKAADGANAERDKLEAKRARQAESDEAITQRIREAARKFQTPGT